MYISAQFCFSFFFPTKLPESCGSKHRHRQCFKQEIMPKAEMQETKSIPCTPKWNINNWKCKDKRKCLEQIKLARGKSREPPYTTTEKQNNQGGTDNYCGGGENKDNKLELRLKKSLQIELEVNKTSSHKRK